MSFSLSSILASFVLGVALFMMHGSIYMFNIALPGMPFVLSYTMAIYWIFRGKVKIAEDSY